MTSQEPERVAVIASYESRMEMLLGQIADRPPHRPLPQDEAGMPWLAPVSILANALRAERWDPTPKPR